MPFQPSYARGLALRSSPHRLVDTASRGGKEIRSRITNAAALARVALRLALLLPAPAFAASFPCEKAREPDEAAICAERSLNDLDVEMAVRFDILKDRLPMGNRAKLQEDQETWLAERRACAADKTCLEAAYLARLKILRGLLAEFAKQGPL